VSDPKPNEPEQQTHDIAATLRENAKLDINKDLTDAARIGYYKEMVRIRRFEERSIRAYQQGMIGGFLHLYIGQEAVAVGCVSLMGENDHIITTYRDHGHALAVGMTMNECMAELYGKHTGCSKGKGGSMHFFAPDKNFWGGHGIVGGQTPLGAGIAFALKYQKKKGSCLCFMGDGATNQGPLYESLNLASLWDLPVVYIIENNGFSMGTSLGRHSIGTPLARRAEGFDIEWKTCYGHDIYEVRANVGEAMKRAHEESRPTVLEIDTYRYRGHSVSDADDTYRTKQEIQEYKDTKDPINLFKDHLLEIGAADEDTLKSINASAKEEADQSAQFADQSPFPPVSDIQADVYWETDNPDERVSEGTLFFNSIK
jgi:pyruvate dehydrogenase E1 component alpha subunit